MLRFVALAVPLVLLVLALGAAVQDIAGLDGDTTTLAARGLERVEPARSTLRLAEWGLESMALTALFLILSGRCGAWWLDGLVTGGLAWVFRGPTLLMTLSRTTSLGPEPWVAITEGWLVLYLVSGLVLGLLARRLVPGAA